MDSPISKAGRYLYAIPFGIFGIFHFMMAGDMAGMVPIPGGIFWVYLTGIALLAACVSFVIEKKVRLAGILLGVMLLIFVVSIHIPGAMAEDPAAAQNATTSALKDLALAGAAFLLAGMYGDEKTVEE